MVRGSELLDLDQVIVRLVISQKPYEVAVQCVSHELKAALTWYDLTCEDARDRGLTQARALCEFFCVHVVRLHRCAKSLNSSFINIHLVTLLNLIICHECYKFNYACIYFNFALTVSDNSIKINSIKRKKGGIQWKLKSKAYAN